MKVLAINSSLRGGGQSKTELLLTHLAEGMHETGAEVEVINLREKKVKYCLGCYTCSTKTPGKCVIKDDMTAELYPKYLDADIAVLATPLFHHTVNAPMKAFIERTWPVYEPFLVQEEDGHWTHPLRHELPSVVLLSVAGFPDISVFEPLSHYMRGLFRGDQLLAEIYRPGAEAMTRLQEKIRNEILDAVRQAGKEIVKDRSISPKTLELIGQPLVDMETFQELANGFWRTCIEEKVTPRTFDERSMVSRPDSLKTFLLIMVKGFNLLEGDATEAVLQFDFTGEQEGSCHFVINKGSVEGKLGKAQNPDMVIETPFEVWVDIMTGKADGAKMFMEGKCKASGDYSLMRLFGA
jgi:multimeric flavodoxin WrbA